MPYKAACVATGGMERYEEEGTRMNYRSAGLVRREQVVDTFQKDAQQSSWGTLMSLPLRFLYWIYEHRLLQQIVQRPMPRHIGIILDGNRRHARQQGLHDPRTIYQRGAKKLDDILDWCAELSIPAVTLWVLSTENFKRSPTEVSGILAAIEAKVRTLALIRFCIKNGFEYRPLAGSMCYGSWLLRPFVPRNQRLRNTIR